MHSGTGNLPGRILITFTRAPIFLTDTSLTILFVGGRFRDIIHSQTLRLMKICWSTTPPCPICQVKPNSSAIFQLFFAFEGLFCYKLHIPIHTDKCGLGETQFHSAQILKPLTPISTLFLIFPPQSTKTFSIISSTLLHNMPAVMTHFDHRMPGGWAGAGGGQRAGGRAARGRQCAQQRPPGRAAWAASGYLIANCFQQSEPNITPSY